MERRFETFLTVCRTMNYRKAAEMLNLTQPAVTKQIQSLESEYGVRLFRYDGRRLYKTEQCEQMESYARSLEYNYEELRRALRKEPRQHLRIGATKTIGDYVVAEPIIRYLKDPSHELTLIVDNTVQLLKMLDDNVLDFAIIEGRFDKKRYAWCLFQKEPFIGAAARGKLRFSGRFSSREAISKTPLSIESLFDETIIVREKGSGTRNLFERDLHGMGYDLSAFRRVIELSSFRLIREAVREGVGITFLYRSVIADEPGLETFCVNGIQGEHEFNVVSLRGTDALSRAGHFLADADMEMN